MSQQPSKRQQAIYDAWENKNHNILIQAVAGSGKTTTLLGLIERTKGKTLYLAFNKSIQLETEQKFIDKGLEKRGKAMTLHSLGLMAIRESGVKFVIKNSKFYHLWKEMEKRHQPMINKAIKEIQKKGVERAAEALYMTMKDMNDFSRLFLTDTYSEIINILLEMDKFPVDNNTVKKLWMEFLQVRASSYTQPKVMIDFVDMLYIPVKFNLIIPIKPKYLMIDECQDLNLVQHKFIDNLVSQGDVVKWIAVGDRNQSIYGFTGAYPESFDKFLTKDNVIEMPLDINYRCARSIVSSANEVYDVMKAHKTDLGSVIIKDLGKIDSLSITPEQDQFLTSLFGDKSKYKDTMVICRNKRPLFNLYFTLLERDIPAKMMGEDILAAVVRMVKPYLDVKLSVIVDILQDELREFEEKANSNEEKAKLFYMKENYANFYIVYNKLCSPNHKGSDLIESFEKLFEDRENAITLCSIHKSKGLESKRVIVLNESLIPSPFAKKPSQIIQETNLKYVARSRAQEELILLEAEFNL